MTTFYERIRKTLTVEPEAPAIEFHGVWHSWGELNQVVEGIDTALAKAGVLKDAAVGCILRNTPMHAGVVLAMFASDHCLVTLNPFYPDATLIADIKKIRPPAVLGSPQDWARPGLKDAVREIGAVGVELTGDKDEPVLLVEGLEAIVGEGHFVPGPDVVVYMLTSGTTGPPKRVPLTRQWVLKTLQDALRLERNRTLDGDPVLRKSVTIHMNVLVHMAGLWSLMNSVMGGFRIVMLDKFTVEDWRQAVVTHRPKVASLPPSGVRMILESDITKEELSSIIALRVGTAPLDPETIDECMRRWDLPVLNNYGSTEFTGVASWTIDDFRKLWTEKRGATGRISPAYDARVIDPETDNIRPTGAEGILELRGDHVWDGKWVRTTDIATIDADRFLYIHGRQDNAINRGGFKVHGEDVSVILNQHPKVREASVVGIKDKRLGTVPVAAVVKAKDAALSEDELRAWARENMLPYQVPVAFRFVDDLPRTPSMKPIIPAIRALFESEPTAS